MLIQGEEKAIVTYNQKYRTLVERVEGKPVEKIDSYVELEQYLGSVILPIRKSIRNNIYWKSKHTPRMLGEAMKKAEELYMKHIYVTGEIPTQRENLTPAEVTINEVDSLQRAKDYTHRCWRNRENSGSCQINRNSRSNPGRQAEAVKSCQVEMIPKEDTNLCKTKKIDSCREVPTLKY